MSTGKRNNRKRKKAEEPSKNGGAPIQPEGRQITSLYDAGYLKWARLTANDTQLLSLRDELRMHRENAEVHQQNIEAHETLKQEMLLVMRMLTHFMVQYQRELGPPVDVKELSAGNDLVAQFQLTQADLNEIGGMLLSFDTTPDDTAWIVTVREPETPPGFIVGSPPVERE